MKKLDCLGDICPVPSLKALEQLQRLQPGETVKIVVDHSCAVTNIREAVTKLAAGFTVEEVANGIWEITLSRK